MKSLTNYIAEKLIINKNYHYDMIVPKSFDELRKIIEDRYDKLGPGTKQKPIDFNDIDVSNFDSLWGEHVNTGIFGGTKFEYIDVSYWDVSKAVDISCAFERCHNLKSLGDLSNWDVSNAENMYGMFQECEKLKSVGDLSKWNVSNDVNTYNMFTDSAITNIPDWYKE